MPTINDYLNSTNGIGEKPATPIEGGSEPIFTPGGQDVVDGPTTRPIGEPSSGAVDKEGNVIDTTGRVGDYVYSNGRAYVVPNSMTDLYRRYGIVRGGTKPQDLKFTDYVNAALSGVGARMGLPTDTSNAATTLGTGFASRLLSTMPVVRDVWGIANAISSLEAAKKAYLDYWMNQDVEYDIALDFSTDENGNQIAKINYEKMKDAGPGSGIAIREATNAENSDALMNGDDSLSVNVSESFANSDLYRDTLEQIKEAYPSLSVDEANTVVNEETGATVLDTIKKFILAQESQYYYNAKSIYDFKQIAPNASQDSLEKAAYTQLMGAMDESSLKEMTVTVYNEKNEMEEKNAEEYLNSIKDLDDRGRENYMVSIGNRVKSDEISDDEKVILQAQANALYMASNNDGPYKDMYRKDFWDSVADTGTLLFGIRSGNLFGIDELTTFEENELFRGGIDLVTGLARFKIQSSVMNKIEGLERLGAQGLGKTIGDNALGRFMQNINAFAPQDTPIRVTDIGKALPNGSTLTAGGFLGRTLTQQGAQMAADVTFDLGKMGAYAIAGEDYDFWDELGTDFFIDALMTYGPSVYIESMAAPKYERRRVAYMGDEYKKGTLDDINKRMEEDEFFDGKYQGPTGAGLYEVKFVELTADELAKRRAEKIDKLTDSKIGLKVQELFFDRNAAMGKLATQIRSVVGGDNYYFRKMLRYSGDIRQLTKDVMNEYKMRDTAKAALSNLGARIQEIAPKAKDFTKADADYVNAIANRTRFLAEWKGDKDAEKAINKFYEKAVNGVSAERAEQLNGLIGAMRQVAADGIDFYGERGILSEKQIRDLRKNPVYKDGIYLPVWTKAGKSLDGDISQGRAKIKSVFDPKVLISVDDLENPIVTIASYLNNIARNVAINDRAMAIREAANIAGVKIHILDDTSGVLSEVSNLRELNADFEKKYQKIVKEVKKAVPTRKQWQEINNKLILDSAAMKGAGELEVLKAESKKLKNELRRTKVEQEKAFRQSEDPEYYERFRQNQDLSNKYRDTLSPRRWYTEDAIVESIVYRDNDMPSDNKYSGSVEHDTARNLEWTLNQILKTSYGKQAFSDAIAEANGDIAKAAYNISDRFFKALVEDPKIASLQTSEIDALENYLVEKAKKFFTKEQVNTFRIRQEAKSFSRIKAEKQRMLDWWKSTEKLRRRLGVEEYAYGYTNARDVSNGEAYGNYNFAGEDGRIFWLDGEGYTANAPIIRIALSTFDSLPEMKSTIVHEAAHAAFSKAENRVPLLTDALRILGVDAKVSREMAASEAATELIAHMTQKRYLAEFLGKTPEQVINRLRDDKVVQGHLNTLMEMMTKPPVNFKERFLEQVQNIITFVKAKLAGNTSLRDVKTLEDFYTGLISGRFASDLRINPIGSKIEQGIGRSELVLDWSKVPPDAEEMALRIIKIQERIDANKQAQLRQMDNIKNEAQRLMEEAQAINKASPVKLDIQSYVDVQLTNELKNAFRSNTPTGEIQAILNKAVEEANPYVSRSSVIAREAGEAARKFRKRVYRDMKVKENVYGKKASDKVNDLVDKVTDHIVTKVTGEQKTLTAIDDNELTRILNNNDDPHTIRYMIDGTEHKMILTGKGSEELVREFYAPEYKATNGVRRILRFGNSIAQAKRYLTTSADPARVLPNLARDWSRGIVTTGGEILLSPDQLRTDAIERGNYTPEQIEKIDNGFRLANEAIDESTFTASMQQPRKNRKKSMIRAMNAPTDGNAFVRFIYDRTESAGKFFSTLQDMGESFTRRRAMTNAYYKELAAATARGLSIDEAVKRATAAAYFYGREATVNFFRRGKLIAEIAQMVPYLSQNFASLESFKYAYLDNPIAVTRSLKATVSTYATLIALALSNDESRKRYFLLTEYDRAHNIIIPLANDLIVTVPLDENVAAFLTPYRRMIETLNGVDPEAFYLWAAEGLEALSPLDLSGFSEGDKFNVVRGFEKIGSQVIPTWAQPILESMTGTDWFYGTDISIDEDYVGARTGNWNPTPGELTTKSKNSEILSHVANATGIPQWIVQNIYSEYGGNVGQYFLNTLDKLTGATEEAQGGKEFFDSIFKPMTGAESDEANNAFWTGVSRLNEEKAALQRELKTIKDKTEAATGEAKADLQKKRQEKIREFGTRVSDFLTQYLSAFEITGGLTKSQANRIWRLYDIYDQDDNEQLYRSGSPEEYFDKQANKQANKETTNLAGLSGLDKFYHTPIDDYHRTYAEQMFRNTIYGSGTQSMVDIANILEDTSDYENSFTKLRSDAIEARKKARTEEDWDNYDKIAYQYDYKVLSALYPYLLEHGIADTLNDNAVIKYLDEWILVPSEEMRTSKGRYVPNLGVDSEKHKAFTKQFIKRMYGVSGE